MLTSVVLVLSSYATLANAKFVCDVTQSWDGSKSIEGHCDGADGAFEDTTFQPGCCADGTSGPYLSGALPPEMGELEDLQIIWLTGNHISGTIPSEWGGLVSLTELRLANDRLSGTIPTELALLTEMTNLELHGNLISGTIPPGVNAMLNPQNAPHILTSEPSPSEPPPALASSLPVPTKPALPPPTTPAASSPPGEDSSSSSSAAASAPRNTGATVVLVLATALAFAFDVRI